MKNILTFCLLLLSGCSLFTDPEAPPFDASVDSTTDVNFQEKDAGDIAQKDGTESDSSQDGSTDSDVDLCDTSCSVNALPSCESFGFLGGVTSCSDACTIDTSACVACDRYVDPDVPDGNNDGGTPESAINSQVDLQTLFSSPLVPDTTICFKRGSEFLLTDQLTLNTSGTDFGDIRLVPYGDLQAANPKIVGWEDVALSPQTGGLSTGVLSRIALGVSFESGGQSISQASTIALSDGDFFIDGVGNITVRTTATTNNTMRVHVARGIEIGGSLRPTRHISMESIDVEGGAYAVLIASFSEEVSDINISGGTFTGFIRGVSIESYDGRGLENISIENVVSTGISEAGIVFFAADASASSSPHSLAISNSTFSGRVISAYIDGMSGIRLSGSRIIGTPGVTDYGIFVTNNPGKNINGLVIERNFITDFDEGIAIRTNAGLAVEASVSTNIVLNSRVAFFANGEDIDVDLIANTFFEYQIGMQTVGTDVRAVNNFLSTQSLTAQHINVTAGQFVNNYFSPSGLLYTYNQTPYDLADLPIPTTGSSDGPRCTTGVPSEPEELIPEADSRCIDAGDPTVSASDFGGRQRNTPPEIGAWEQL